MDENKFPDIFEENEIQSYSIKRLERSKTDYIISGLCGGLGKYYKIDPSILRLIGLLSLLISSIPIYAYIITSIIFNAEIKPLAMDDIERTKINKRNSSVLLSSFLIYIGVFWLLKSVGLMQKENLFNYDSMLINSILILLGIYMIFKNYNKEIIFIDYNEKTDKIIFGVCKYLGEQLKINVTIIRTAFVICTLLSIGIFILLYLFLFINQQKIIHKNEN